MPKISPFVITQCWNNGTVKLKNGATKIAYNIRCINPYKSDTKVEDSNSKNMSDDVEYKLPVSYFCIKSKFGNTVYDQIHTGKLT